VIAAGGGTYSWSAGLGGNAAVSLTQPGTYTVTVTSPNGCADTESITITDDGSLPQIIIEASTNELNCFTSSIELTAVGDAGTLTWTVDGEDCPGVPNTALICSDFYDPICGCDGVTYSNPCYAEREAGVLHYLLGECGSTDGASSIIVNNPGIYTVTLDVDGCVATYSFEVEENLEVPSASVTAASPICSNENAVFTISGTAGDVVTYTTTGGASIETITMDTSGSNDVVVNAPSSDVTLELIDVTGLFPLTGGACSFALLALAAAIDLELLLIIIIIKNTMFLNYLRTFIIFISSLSLNKNNKLFFPKYHIMTYLSNNFHFNMFVTLVPCYYKIFNCIVVNILSNFFN
jgi:hypothetical protein